MDLFLRFHNHFFFTFTKGSTITKTGQSFFCLIACILSSVPLLLSTGTPQQIEKICISTEPYHKTWPNPFNLSLRQGCNSRTFTLFTFQKQTCLYQPMLPLSLPQPPHFRLSVRCAETTITVQSIALTKFLRNLTRWWNGNLEHAHL